MKYYLRVMCPKLTFRLYTQHLYSNCSLKRSLILEICELSLTMIDRI